MVLPQEKKTEGAMRMCFSCFVRPPAVAGAGVALSLAPVSSSGNLHNSCYNESLQVDRQFLNRPKPKPFTQRTLTLSTPQTR